MDFITTNLILIGIVLTSGGMLLWQTFQGHSGAKGLTPAQAVHAQNREKALFIDVSDPRTATIKGAKHVDLSKLEQELAQLVKKKDNGLIFFCHQGMRAEKACRQAEKLGYSNVWVLAGGLKNWQKENYPLQTLAA